ncbi:CRE-CYP-13A8 protein [Caenorhabditis remanei]|uniref:CRE-CYP-13A8 protein n=1 Tax=Caenorhabditis remanei TaxID=31234 RepID=E3MZW1_CAERE|nr:CRE-CYP-13A8 protein [Caenorhabditis remanei]
MLLLLVFIAISTYYIYHWTFWKRRGVPGPWGIPIFGKSGTMLDDRVAPPLVLQQWTQKYGKIYGFTEGMQKVMVISDPNLVQEVFVKQYDNFYGRKHNPVQGDPDKDKDIHIIGAQGFRWKRLRSITAPAFSNNSIKKVLSTMEDSSHEFMKHLEEKAGNGQPVNMHLFFQEYTMDVIMRIAMGQPDSRMFNNPILYDCKGFFENSRWPIWMFGGAFPFAVTALKYIFLKLGKFGAGPFIRIQKSVTDAVMARIAQREADKKNGIELGESQDFIDLFLDARVDNVEHFGETNDEFHKSTVYDNRQLTTAEIISQCFVFMVAGFDTTSISLSYVAYFLALHPEVQKKVQEEVDKECPDPEITFDQLSKLKYMENTIKEALRLFPMAAFANSRHCMRTTKIGDQLVEAGVDVQLDTWTLHHDKQIWGEDVEEFKPERWESPLNPHQAFLSFGAGPRQCLGMRLAYLEQKSVLVHMLRKYSFVPNMQTQVPMKLVGRATSRPESLILTLKARH